MCQRFAVYYAPEEDSELGIFGRNWLGRGAKTGNSLPQLKIDVIHPRRMARITASPRHYGWHGTLKPPFRLLPEFSEADVYARAQVVAVDWTPIEIGPLTLTILDGFFALVPASTCPDLDKLAASCVRAFDLF